MAVAASVFSGSALFWLTWQRFSLLKHSPPMGASPSNPTEKILHLAIEEKTRLIGYSPASSITFYRGPAPTEHLHSRVKGILTCNPYLTLRLKKLKRFSSEILAVYDDTHPDIHRVSEHFEVVKDASITHDIPFTDLMRRVDKYQTKVGKKCINRNEVIFKVTLITIRDNFYAIVVSLNHMIGDGYTFYKLSSMLSTTVTPYSLDALRNQHFKVEVERLLCPHFLSLLKNPLVAIGFLYNTIVYSPLKPYVCVVNKSFVESEKSSYNQKTICAVNTDSVPTSSPFVSTNDILMSWYVRFSKCTYAGMVVNFRNRLKGYTDTMAGNYTRSVMYCAKDIQSPGDVRESLQHMDAPYPHQRVGGRSSPNTISDALALLTLNFAGATSWASFYEDVTLPVSEVILHLPVMSLANMGCRSALIIFKCNSKDTAIVYWGTNKPIDLVNEPIICRLLM